MIQKITMLCEDPAPNTQQYNEQVTCKWLYMYEYMMYGIYIHCWSHLTFSAGVVYAFNTQISSKARQLLKSLDVPVKEHNIIYKMIDDLKEELIERLDTIEEEETLGKKKFYQTLILYNASWIGPIFVIFWSNVTIVNKLIFNYVNQWWAMCEGCFYFT